mmetsp:Transcript_25480/g.41929  ORF Transcript_25480/g.41929 Transcript_25480/m.41929 type:complete len:557 (-) Transcript_25480:462-2132(-)|eukprot:CAMPEP_0184663416 /NCGR_PEP_ID=MMETSP0308-20130426/48000_1 /TAXON_ID=38269 /ORGANISM="Gloeochaete witrockiana, Strain SAG 46.84" /LENGTH=556 /DNA_ID=CAMNT_0027106133 /DNA_START=47 /DNA_END=1717 /DNA_ORIENTATION=+
MQSRPKFKPDGGGQQRPASNANGKSRDNQLSVDISRLLVQKMLATNKSPSPQQQTNARRSSDLASDQGASGAAIANARSTSIISIDDLPMPKAMEATGELEAGNGRVMFNVGSTEVHERPVDDVQCADSADDRIDLEEILRPVFDDLIRAGKSEEEMVTAMGKWMQSYLGNLTDADREATSAHLNQMFAHTQAELTEITHKEAAQFEKLFSAVKDAVETEVDVLHQKLKGGSFKLNLIRLATQQDEIREQEHQDEVSLLKSEIEELQQKLQNQSEKSSKQADRSKSAESDVARWQLRELQLQQEKEALARELERCKAENERLLKEHEASVKALSSDNEALVRIVVEMRQHQARRADSAMSSQSKDDWDRMQDKINKIGGGGKQKRSHNSGTERTSPAKERPGNSKIRNTTLADTLLNNSVEKPSRSAPSSSAAIHTALPSLKVDPYGGGNNNKRPYTLHPIKSPLRTAGVVGEMPVSPVGPALRSSDLNSDHDLGSARSFSSASLSSRELAPGPIDIGRPLSAGRERTNGLTVGNDGRLSKSMEGGFSARRSPYEA